LQQTEPVLLRLSRLLPVMSSLICMCNVPFYLGKHSPVTGCSKSKNLAGLVGYAAVDADSTWLDPFANYLTCDPNGNGSGDTSIDIFGLNN